MVPSIEVHDVTHIDAEMRKKILKHGYSGLNNFVSQGTSPLEAVAILMFELDMLTHRCAAEGLPSQAIQSARYAGQVMAEAECVVYDTEDATVN